MKRHVIAIMAVLSFLIFRSDSFSGVMEIKEKDYQYQSEVAAYEKTTAFVIARRDVFHQIPKIDLPHPLEEKIGNSPVNHDEKHFAIKVPHGIAKGRPFLKHAVQGIGLHEDTPSNPDFSYPRPYHATLYFNIDSARISDDEMKKLNALFKHGRGKRIRAAAYTCPLGPLEWNQLLAKRRVDAVDRFFKSKGMRLFKKTSQGSCCYISLNKNEYWKNRRVEIFFKKTDGPDE